MRVINSQTFFGNRNNLSDKFPFTVKINTNSEQYFLVCESLRAAIQYCVEFLKSAPVNFRNEYAYISKVDMIIFRTDGNFNLIKDFIPQKLSWNILGKTVTITFKELRMTDGVRLKSYINQLQGMVVR